MGKGAKRGAHQTVRESSNVPPSAVQDEGGAFLYTLAPADRGSDLLARIGE
jgi:hypothetical protein